MIGFAVLLLACFSAVFAEAPRYVQSNEAFTYAKTYLSLRLAPQGGEPDINTRSGRTYHSFGVFVGLTAATTHPYVGGTPTALDLIYKELPHSWNNYDEISRTTIGVLNEASDKVTLIVDLINSCNARSVEECNRSIDQKVRESPEIYRDSAVLMLLLGKAGTVIRDNSKLLDEIAEANKEVPYLLHNAESNYFKREVAEVKRAYDKIQRIQMRRSSGSQ